MTIVASSELYLQTAFASLSEGIFAHAANIGERDGAKPSQQEDYECLTGSGEGMVYLASISRLLRCFAPATQFSNRL